MEFNITAANIFWQWFSNHHKELGENFDNEKALVELDNQILDLGDFAWEIGPGIKGKNQLVISPGGNISLLPITKQIIANATNIPGWVFCYAKPPKQWQLLYDFRKENGDVIEIDASKWKYVLVRYEEGFEIIIQTNDLTNLSKEDKLIASEILLDGILGEEFRMLHITYIDIVEVVDHQYVNKINDMTCLGRHLNELMP